MRNSTSQNEYSLVHPLHQKNMDSEQKLGILVKKTKVGLPKSKHENHPVSVNFFQQKYS